MNETIKINNQNYAVKNVNTGLNTISFVIDDPAAGDVEALFRNTKAFEVIDEDGKTYGDYPDVEFQSLTIQADGSISITMHIPSEMEKQVRELQTSVAEHDEAIAQLLYGEVGHNE